MEAWGDMDEDSFFDAPTETTPKPTSTSTKSAANPFEDNGEPDFAGWLAAQAQKKPGAKPLPKGLAKPANGGASARPASAARVSTTGSIGTAAAKKVGAPVVKKPVVSKKVDTAPKATDDDDGWGDGW